ncbi:MAG: type II toxin-antitoxin system VapC family toxin [Methylothermaceae bacterium]|nr:type II toxin-antitoxin system VapC family toxin [Methylothermaceae bacterium]
MKKVVIDASVAVKWFLREASDEDHIPEAVAILRAIGERRLSPVQPPHWLAEIASVLARRYPEAATPAVDLLVSLEIPHLSEPDCYRRAIALAKQLDHHLFDTLYHAVALQSSATLITADRHYWRKADSLGRITLLNHFDHP